ncbi:MAG: hypothetical protein N2167_01495 [Flavobacteriales bacterium]|nr:hypothetical protein [Flavobacteriales bacterium]
MRIIDTIPHPDMRISILYMNEKFIVRIEDGPYEQHYKLTKDMASTIEQVKEVVDESFLKSVRETFEQMHQQFKEAYFRNKN